MSSLAKKIKNAPDLETVNDCLKELASLIALASKRVEELEAEELDRRITEAMSPDIQ
jgi:hypothetical protein